MTLGSSGTAGGWSHSWVTAVTSSPRPSAKSISVADGTSETMRMCKDMGEDMSVRRVDYSRVALMNDDDSSRSSGAPPRRRREAR